MLSQMANKRLIILDHRGSVATKATLVRFNDRERPTLLWRYLFVQTVIVLNYVCRVAME